MINVQRPLSVDQFRGWFERTFEYLFVARPNRSFAGHIGELNDIILLAQADGLTVGRQFTLDELAGIQHEVFALHEGTNFPSQRKEAWEKLLVMMRDIGLEEELLPRAEACRI